MAKNLMIAWATELDACHLAARLEAYGETKPALEAFRLLDLKLPEIIISIISNMILDDAYAEKIESWVQADRCLTGQCTDESHFTAKELHDSFRVGCRRLETPYEAITEDYKLSNASRSRHQDIMEDHLDKLTAKPDPNLKNKFGVYQEACHHLSLHYWLPLTFPIL